LRRIITIGTALAVLGAGAALAASNFNTYSGSNLAFPGSAKALGEKVTLKAGSTQSGDRAAPLVHIKFTIYGVKLDVGKLPACSDAKVLANKTNPMGACPTGSLIGSGITHALLGPGSDPSTSKGTACNPHINVFNGGPKTQIFYFWTNSANDCGGLTTGATAPYDGHISYKAGNAIVDIPLPPDISNKVANQPGLYGSLIQQNVTYGPKVQGKVYMQSVACKKGKRPWSITYTAQLYNSTQDETQTVRGSSKC